MTGEIGPGRCEALLYWNLHSSGTLSPSKGVIHSLLVTGCCPHGEGCALNGKPSSPSSMLDVESWSIHLSTDFVRRSFSLPIISHSSSTQSFAPCLLTMHESNDVTYLVLQEDIAPRLIIQNLTAACFQVAELSGSTGGPHSSGGINACPQMVPSGSEVVYEPPSLAKLYPVVFDEDIATERDRRMQQVARSVKVRLRRIRSPVSSENEAENSHRTPSDTISGRDGSSEGQQSPTKISRDFCRVLEGWSEPFLVGQSHDTDLQVAGFGSLLVSTDARSDNRGTFISLLPGSPSNPCQQLTSRLRGVASARGGPTSSVLKCNVRVDRLVVSVGNDTMAQSSGSSEILRVIVSGLSFSHSSLAHDGDGDGATIDLAVSSLRVDNMMKRSFEDFAVAFLPRDEHAAPQQLISQEPPPFIHLQTRYNPHCRFQISSVRLCMQSATVQLEDRLLQKLRHLAGTFGRPGGAKDGREETLERFDDFSTLPLYVLHESQRDARPVTISSLVIEPVSVFVSANISLRAYLSCKDTPFSFSRYELVGVFSNWPEVTQIVAARYVSAVFMHVGWVLGSLELIGSPVSFIQSVNRGLMDLVRLPYEGLTRSPGLFIVGIGQGTASFVRQCSSGALTSVTNLASSIARNMERLSMDPDHVTYQDRQRREHPSLHFMDGVASGMSSFGLSLISAVAGLVDQPMQSFQHMEETDGTATTLLKGVGKGLIGAVTKPVGGAMDLVSKAGQGIMHGTGLAQRLEHCLLPEEVERFVQGRDRREMVMTCGGCSRSLEGVSKVVYTCSGEVVLVGASRVGKGGGGGVDTQPCILLLTLQHLYVLTTPTPSHTPSTPSPSPSSSSSSSCVQVFPVQSCSITTSTPTTATPSPSSSHLIELCIRTTPLETRGAEALPAVGGDFDRVEWFVQQSNAELQHGEMGSAGENWEIVTKVGSGHTSGGTPFMGENPFVGGSPLNSPKLRRELGAMIEREEGEGMKREEGEEDGECSPSGEHLVVRMEACVGQQLLTVYQSLQYNTAHSVSIYMPLKLDTS